MRDKGTLVSLYLQHNLSSLEEVRSIPLRLGDNKWINLERVAEINIQPLSVSSALLTPKGEGLLIQVFQRPGSDLLETSRAVRKEISRWKETYPNTDILILDDAAGVVSQTLSNLGQNLWLGSILALGMVFLLMGSLRRGLLVALLLPLSLGLAGLGFAISSLGINLLTLSGLIIAVGILIDNGIIVIENIERLDGEGMAKDQSIIHGVGQVFLPLLTATLTTLCVFLPPSLLGGIYGYFFKDQALSIIWTLSASLLVALVFIPILSRQLDFFLKKYIPKLAPQRNQVKSAPFLREYENGLLYCLKAPLLPISILVLLLCLSLILGFSLPKEIFPTYEKDEVNLEVSWEARVDFEENYRRTEELCRRIQKLEGFDAALAFVGNFSLPGQRIQRQANQSLIQVQGRKVSSEKLDFLLKDLENRFPMAVFSIKESRDVWNSVLPPEKSDLVLEFGQPGSALPLETEELNEFLSYLKSHPATQRVFLPYAGSRSQLVLSPSYNKMVRAGIAPSEVYKALTEVFASTKVGQLNDINNPLELKIDLRKHEAWRKTLQEYRLPNYGIPLAELVEINYRQVPSVLYGRAADIRRAVNWNGKGDIVEIIREAESLAREKGLTLRVSGGRMEGASQFRELVYILLGVIGLLYLIIAAQFESLWMPFLVIMGLPIAGGASLIGLALGFSSINLISGLGILIVFGISVNDSILKLSTILQYQKEGMKLEQAISKAGKDRFRPIILTSLTTILAVLPLIFDLGGGVGIQRSLAVAVIGGMIGETLYSLFVLPVGYAFFRKRFLP